MSKNLLMWSVVGVLGCGEATPESGLCSNEEADINRVPTAIPPDWEAIQSIDSDDALNRTTGLNSEPALAREHIQAWDCLDLSWWTPAEPKKVVQIWTDETSCELFEHSTLQIFECDSHEGADDIYRDQDGDGFYSTEGDCNDNNAVVAPDAAEICDSVDNDCDGIADEYLDCSDIEALGDAM